jgi:hypothetical protein
MPYRLAFPLLAVLLLLTCAAPARAHVVTMKDGTRYEGKVIRQDDAQVVIETTFDGVKTLARADVASVDLGVAPLRVQLKQRADLAKDVRSRWALYQWAKQKGFGKELRWILQAILDLSPQNGRAHKLLGDHKVEGRWMSPEEEAAWRKRKLEAAQRAKGLVPYKGGWVTPAERDAREKGLRKDGDEWVTEAEWHRRRGETLVDGTWVRLGFKEGQALCARVVREARLNLSYHWSPHFDALAEVNPQITQHVLDACEKGWRAMRKVLVPSDDDYPATVDERIHLVLLVKLPSFVRFANWFDKAYDVQSLAPGWASAVQRQHGWWWIQDVRASAVYQFPNPEKTFVSNVLHNVGLILLTRYRANFREPSVWLREGFAYLLELRAIGYSASFTLGRGGGSGGAAQGTSGPIWTHSEKWHEALAALVGEGQDPPLKRLARMTVDQFRYVELVKSWSVVEFLVRWDKARFKRFVDLAKDRSKEEEDALKEAYGVGYRQLDTRWRAYVGNGFKVP